jgi:hypothetical protein
MSGNLIHSSQNIFIQNTLFSDFINQFLTQSFMPVRIFHLSTIGVGYFLFYFANLTNLAFTFEKTISI